MRPNTHLLPNRDDLWPRLHKSRIQVNLPSTVN